MTPAELIPGEFVKVSITRRVQFLGAPEVHTSTLWYFARFIATVDHQAVIEDATGERCLVDATQIHALDTTTIESGM